MAGGPSQFSGLGGPQASVHFFKRAEEPGEALFKAGRTAPALQEIAMAELVCSGDDSGPHGPVFVRALRPGEGARAIDPDGKSHEGTPL